MTFQRPPDDQEIVYVNVVDTAKLIRKELKVAYPGIKFSVTSKRGLGPAIYISWESVPAREPVDKLIDKYRGRKTDRSVPLMWEDRPVYIMRDDKWVHYSVDFIFLRPAG